MGSTSTLRLCNVSNNNDWIVGINRMESYCDLFKFYSFNAYSKHGNEYSCYSEISSTKKGIFFLLKASSIDLDCAFVLYNTAN